MQLENKIEKFNNFINQLTETITFGFITYLETDNDTINLTRNIDYKFDNVIAFKQIGFNDYYEIFEYFKFRDDYVLNKHIELEKNLIFIENFIENLNKSEKKYIIKQYYRELNTYSFLSKYLYKNIDSYFKEENEFMFSLLLKQSTIIDLHLREFCKDYSEIFSEFETTISEYENEWNSKDYYEIKNKNDQAEVKLQNFISHTENNKIAAKIFEISQNKINKEIYFLYYFLKDKRFINKDLEAKQFIDCLNDENNLDLKYKSIFIQKFNVNLPDYKNYKNVFITNYFKDFDFF